jgi:NAD dependent epimerase/dehydratase family enzyme
MAFTSPRSVETTNFSETLQTSLTKQFTVSVPKMETVNLYCFLIYYVCYLNSGEKEIPCA